MGRGERAILQGAALLLAGGLVAGCTSSSSGPDTNAGRSPASPAASTTLRTEGATQSPSAAAGSPRPDSSPTRSASSRPPMAGMPVVDCTKPTKKELRGAKSPAGSITSIYIRADAAHPAFAVTDVDDKSAELNITTRSGYKSVQGNGTEGNVVYSTVPATWTFRGSWQTFCAEGDPATPATSRADNLAQVYHLKPVMVVSANANGFRDQSRREYEKEHQAA